MYVDVPFPPLFQLHTNTHFVNGMYFTTLIIFVGLPWIVVDVTSLFAPVVIFRMFGRQSQTIHPSIAHNDEAIFVHLPNRRGPTHPPSQRWLRCRLHLVR